MARRVARPPPAGMPKFKLAIPTEAPVQIESEKVNANEVGSDAAGSPTGPLPPSDQQKNGVAAEVATSAVPPLASGAAAAPVRPLAPAPGGPPLTAALLAAHTAARLNDAASAFAPPSAFIGIGDASARGMGMTSSTFSVMNTARSTTSVKRAIIQFDETLVSPVVAMGFHDPSGGASLLSSSSHLAATRVSPTTMGCGAYAFPNGGGAAHSNGVSPTTSAAGGGGGFPTGGKKFYQVNQSNLYVFEEGAPLVRDDGYDDAAHQQWSELMMNAGAGAEDDKGIVGSAPTHTGGGLFGGGGGLGGRGGAVPSHRFGSVDEMATPATCAYGDHQNTNPPMAFPPPSSGGGMGIGGGTSSSFGMRFERTTSTASSQDCGPPTMGPPVGSNGTIAGEPSFGGAWGSPTNNGDSPATSPTLGPQLLLSPKRAPLPPPMALNNNNDTLLGGALGSSSARNSRNNRSAPQPIANSGTATPPPSGAGPYGRTPPQPLTGLSSAGRNNPPQPQQPPQPPRGDRTIYLSQLEMLEMVGAGQQGTVFKCKHRDTNAVYALKKLSMAALQDNPDPIERQARKASIVRELKMLTECRHVSRNLVALHNAYFQNDELMVLMEWMGTNVEDLLKLVGRVPQETVQQLAKETLQRGFGGDKHIPIRIKSCGSESAKMMERARINRGTALPEVIAAVITYDVLKGLAYLHKSLRIVHTDLKPANILLTVDGTESKIADFGCSMRLGDDGKVRYKGVTLGTKLYMPPDRVNSLMMAGPEDESSLFMSVPFSCGMPATAGSAGASGGTAAFVPTLKPTATIEAFQDNMAEATSGAFDEKADIWSFGIVLLELVNGCHPCQALARDNYWNYANDLRFQNLIRPAQMSDLLHEVLQKCLAVEPAKRPSAEEVLKMPFFQKYKDVDRKKFSLFVERLKKSAASFEIENRRRELTKQIKASLTATTTTTYHGNQSKNLWAKHNNYLDRSGLDANNFPSLPGM